MLAPLPIGRKEIRAEPVASEAQAARGRAEVWGDAAEIRAQGPAGAPSRGWRVRVTSLSTPDSTSTVVPAAS